MCGSLAIRITGSATRQESSCPTSIRSESIFSPIARSNSPAFSAEKLTLSIKWTRKVSIVWQKEKSVAARNLGASLDSEFLWFNQSPSGGVPDWKRKWFSSAAFRHAISASIHRDDIARIVFRGHAHPAAGPFSPSNRYWYDASLKPLPFDAAAALGSLAKEGFILRDGVLHDRDGHAVEFSLITNSGNRPREAMAAVVQDDLRQIGVQVNASCDARLPVRSSSASRRLRSMRPVCSDSPTWR